MAPGGYGVWRSHSPSLTTPDHKTGKLVMKRYTMNIYIYCQLLFYMFVCLFVLNV